MSLNEFLVIAAGLIAGWLVVSRMIASSACHPANLPDGDWFDVLSVAPDATPEQIDAAYERKRLELQERELRVMTRSEEEKAAHIRAVVDAAYQSGISLRRD